ncbi:hypothetical protein [Actinomadura rayongensis]|uniref:Glutathionylspermidine synthase pre-ATP-grasp-like domain-containing protein n=1 Tax=Actinomadura rayongensis TaxID=1429076 RepID=A0A6I4WDR4_9ACTN|nr:hypothetical protein [Actinomadura rayongensis]MXQ65986.1 hypothetical protein [Actinomadura rayongensis]
MTEHGVRGLDVGEPAPAAPDDLPLVDPRRRMSGRPGSSPVLATAYDEVCERVADEALMQISEPGAPRVPFPVRPVVSVLHPRAEPELRRRVQSVVGSLEKLVRAYPDDPELQDFLAVPETLHRWIMRGQAAGRLGIDYCRLDLLGATLGTARVLEFNPSSPGGVISTGMLNRFWRESSLAPVLAAWAPAPAPFEGEHWFADWLLGFGRSRGVPDDGRPIGLFHASKSTKFELDLVARQLAARGRETVFIRADDADAARDVRLGYFKFIPMELDEVPGWDRFCARLLDGTIAAPNPLGARWVAENKLCLAALSDPRFRRLFDPAEIAHLDALVPYGRKLGDGIDAAEVLRRRDELVLKAPYSFHGRDVHLGAECDPDAWERIVTAHRGWLVQERVQAGAVDADDGTYLHDLVAPVLDGRVIGYSARMSAGPVLNGARGGGAYAIFGPHPLGNAVPSPLR